MTDSNYRKLTVWQKSRALTKSIYRETATFPRVEMFGLVQQMRRAAISILCNIAEGQGRYSRPDTAHFIIMARGSAMELEAQIAISADLGYLSVSRAEALELRVIEVIRMLNGMLRHFTSK